MSCQLAARHGPRTIMIAVATCQDCPALRLVAWADGGGTHRRADCAHLTASRQEITPYWRDGRPAPHWCPAAEPEVLYDTAPIAGDAAS